MLSKDSKPDLIGQARQIAQGGKPPKAAWSELKSWAQDKGPLAMRSAAMEFITVYGRSPDALLLMPEVLRSSTASFMPPRPLMDGSLSIKPGFSIAKPAINFEPKGPPVKGSVPQIQLKTSFELPARPEGMVHFDATKSPDSKVLGASKGHHIVRSLIHKMKSHAADSPRAYQGEPAVKKTKKKMTKKKPARKTAKKKARKR